MRASEGNSRSAMVEVSMGGREAEDGSETKAFKERRSGSSRIGLSSVISCIQAQRLPRFLRKDKSGEGTPIISGLDRVLFGTQPAAEVMTILGFHPPRYLCYMLSGAICDVLQFFVDVFVHLVLLLEDASICWALGFGISVVFRHTTHRYLVFGDYVGGYWASLRRMYAGYSVIIVLSTIFNFVMTRYAKLPHYVAWIITLLWTGIVNYFILKKLWSFGGKPKREDSSEEESTQQLTPSRRSK